MGLNQVIVDYRKGIQNLPILRAEVEQAKNNVLHHLDAHIPEKRSDGTLREVNADHYDELISKERVVAEKEAAVGELEGTIKDLEAKIHAAFEKVNGHKLVAYYPNDPFKFTEKLVAELKDGLIVIEVLKR